MRQSAELRGPHFIVMKCPPTIPNAHMKSREYHRHETEEGAKAEAERLAGLTKGIYAVYQCVGIMEWEAES